MCDVVAETNVSKRNVTECVANKSVAVHLCYTAANQEQESVLCGCQYGVRSCFWRRKEAGRKWNTNGFPERTRFQCFRSEVDDLKRTLLWFQPRIGQKRESFRTIDKTFIQIDACWRN